MSSTWTGRKVREAVGVFHDPDGLQNAIDALLSHGFDRAELSLLAGEAAVERSLGHAWRGVRELEDDEGVARVSYRSAESLGDAQGGLIGGLVYVGAMAGAGGVLVLGGPMVTTLIAAVLAGGTGCLAGLVLARRIGRRRAARLGTQLAHGGLLLWVQTRTPDFEARAMQILSAHGAIDVHVHDRREPQKARGGPEERKRVWL